MKIRMKTTISGTRNGQPWPARGDVIDLPDDEAAQLCANGGAVPVADDDVETAVPDDDSVETRTGPVTKDNAGAVVPGNADSGDDQGDGDAGNKTAAKPAAKAAAAKPAAK